ncbi:MAG TPA: response regulator [Geomonas sp.]|nr:response regulator [Geomonas sp.]
MGNRLLLADDSITIQKVVAIIFANEEFELTVVDNGTAALDKAREIQPDLMLVDALMPGKTGYEVCSEIRRDPKLGPTPLLLLIGAFEPLDEEKARSCGADATISKPFESQQLIDKVKELLVLGSSRKAAPAPAPAAPEPAGAETVDIWGDLSSLDTMSAAAQPAPVKAPAAPAVQEAVAAQAAPAAAAPSAPSIAAPAAPAAAAVQEELVEASMEDDLWGAFDLEEEAPSGGFGVIEPGSDFEAEEFFSFEEDSEEVLETGAAVELVEEPAVEASAEELFVLEETPYGDFDAELVSEPETAKEAVFELPEYEPFSFEEEAAEESAAPAPASAPAFEAAPAVQAAPAAAAAPVSAPAAAPAAASQAAPAAALSEEAIVAALSKLSKEVIERIVWEVVPDLAEVLIKEEIRKLKEGLRG